MFALVNNRYVELIFRINFTFAQGPLLLPTEESEENAQLSVFIEAWRRSKLLELAAIESADGALAVLAAQHARSIWSRQVELRLKRRHHTA